ncbi:MAG: nucleoside triphosphate pyrophosphohydrolase [Syntrophobacteria bacterium]
MAETGKEFEELMQLVARLRAEDGCPWDRQQTPATVKNYLLEEAYEVVDAVEHHPPDHVKEELGDLVFMAIFLAHLYQEQGHFHMDQVLRRTAVKMIRRHPHVFGDRKVDSAWQVRQTWEEVKSQERPGSTPLGTILGEVPPALPALMRSCRILSRLRHRLGRTLRQDIIRNHLDQSFSSLLEQDFTHDGQMLSATLGKVLLLLVALTLTADLNAEEALTRTLESFCEQVSRMEASFGEKGRDWQDLSEAEEQSFWEEF